MTEGTIGPIPITHAHLYDDNNININGEENFTITLPNTEARQIMGLASTNNTHETYNNITTSTTNNPWGIVYLDTSNTLKDNEDILHRGWYLITGAEPTTDLGAKYVHLTVTAIKISSNPNEYLEMDYTPGVEDGTSIPHTYTETNLITTFHEDFSGTTYNTYFTNYQNDGLTNITCTPTSGKLKIEGRSTNNGTAAGLIINGNTDLTNTYTAEFGLEWVATPTSNYHYGAIYLTQTSTHPLSDLNVIGPLTSWIRIILRVGSSGVYYYLDRAVNGRVQQLTPERPLTSANKTPNFKITHTPGDNLNFYVDEAGGTNYTKLWGGNTGLNWRTMYMHIVFASNTTTLGTIRIPDINVYNYGTSEDYADNIVVLPANSTPLTTPDFYRSSYDGNIPCYINPDDPLNFYSTPTSIYDGCVNAYNSNYSDSTPRLVTWTDEVLEPGDFYVTNGLIKLDVNTNATTPIVFSYYSSPGFTELNRFGLGESIHLIKPLHISPDRHIYQINNTKWTINRGKPFVYVEHPNDALGFTRKTSCYHDGILHSGLADNADVSMLSQFYSLHFNPYNILTDNLYGVEEGLDGFYVVSSTLEQVSGATYGTYHLKCISKNLQASEGVYLDGVSLPIENNTGLIFGGRVYLKGTGTWKLLISERKSDDTVLNTTSSASFTLTSTPSSRNVYHTIISSEAEKLNLMIYTDGQQSAEFYGDVFQLAPSPVANQAMYSISPLTANRYGMLIMKKDPTTIKSDSIPASEITGIGVYDQMQPPISNDHYLQLAREWYKPTRQNITIRTV